MAWKNSEGYADNTAGMAISNMVKRERKEKKTMAKKNWRRSNDEAKIHDKAVKIRKMTDSQLVEYIENRVEKARSEGRNEARKDGDLKKFLVSLSAPGVIPGVGACTVDKIKKYAEESGYFG